VGLLIPSATNFFFARVLKGVEKVAAETGYNIVISQTDDDPEREKAAIRSLVSLRVAGVLGCLNNSPEVCEMLREVLEDEMPLVLFDRLLPVECDQVISDDFGGAFRAVEYMIHSGARRVAYYSSTLREHTGAERFRGYKEALKKYDIPFDERLVLDCSHREDAMIMTPDFIRTVGVPDAILATNDQTAAGILQSAKMLGISVPDQMQLCGFSNDMITRHTDPLLSTVQQHAREVGEEAMRHLLSRIEEKEAPAPPQTMIMPTDLIVRESTH
jgi:LacI family transcriptional regulator